MYFILAQRKDFPKKKKKKRGKIRRRRRERKDEILIKVDSPQLPVAPCRVPRPGVHHGRVVVDEPVADVPRQAGAHAVVVQQVGDDVDELGLVVVDEDLARGELGLAAAPGLVPADAGLVAH